MHKDKQQGNVIDLTYTENDASEDYVVMDLTISPKKTATSKSTS